MRIISGSRRGMKLMLPKRQEGIRPTQDRTKEAVFDIIQPVKRNSVVLDLFAAEGQIGLEFLSRGAAFCVFSEKSREVGRALEYNIEKTRFQDQSQVCYGDYRTNIHRTGRTFDYVYLDPPYYQHMEKTAMDLLLQQRKLKEGALVILEAASDDDSIDEEAAGYQMVFKRTYRFQTIRIFKEVRDV